MQSLRKNRKGFTMIELVIVIIIIGILATVAVPMYRGYTRRAIASEGKALVGAIASAEKAYLAEHNAYLDVAQIGIDTVLDIDAQGNKYYTEFAVSSSGNGHDGSAAYDITAIGIGDASGMDITLSQADLSSQPSLTEPTY